MTCIDLYLTETSVITIAWLWNMWAESKNQHFLFFSFNVSLPVHNQNNLTSINTLGIAARNNSLHVSRNYSTLLVLLRGYLAISVPPTSLCVLWQVDRKKRRCLLLTLRTQRKLPVEKSSHSAGLSEPAPAITSTALPAVTLQTGPHKHTHTDLTKHKHTSCKCSELMQATHRY